MSSYIASHVRDVSIYYPFKAGMLLSRDLATSLVDCMVKTTPIYGEMTSVKEQKTYRIASSLFSVHFFVFELRTKQRPETLFSPFKLTMAYIESRKASWILIHRQGLDAPSRNSLLGRPDCHLPVGAQTIQCLKRNNMHCQSRKPCLYLFKYLLQPVRSSSPPISLYQHLGICLSTQKRVLC